jgi:hypothetical protein
MEKKKIFTFAKAPKFKPYPTFFTKGARPKIEYIYYTHIQRQHMNMSLD